VKGDTEREEGFLKQNIFKSSCASHHPSFEKEDKICILVTCCRTERQGLGGLWFGRGL